MPPGMGPRPSPPPTCWCCGEPADELYVLDALMHTVRVRWADVHPNGVSKGNLPDELLCADCVDTIAGGGDVQSTREPASG
jgi:hypothetical protein